MIKAGKPINFTSVADAANVSTTWLYEEAKIKERIQQLRDQRTPPAKSKKSKSRMSDGSKDAMIATLKQRVKTLEQRNRELSQQNEVFGGQVYRVRELEQQIKRLQTENTLLRQGGEVTLATPKTEVEIELEQMGVQLNSTIRRLVKEAPQAAIQTALQSLREAILQNWVENPSGFFHHAVTYAWSLNEPIETVEQRNLFSEWYPLAREAELVVAATEIQGVQHVLNVENQWVSFCEMRKQFSLQTLSRIAEDAHSSAIRESVCDSPEC